MNIPILRLQGGIVFVYIYKKKMISEKERQEAQNEVHFKKRKS